MPPPKEGWQRSRVIALFATEALAREAASVLELQDFFSKAARSSAWPKCRSRTGCG